MPPADSVAILLPRVERIERVQDRQDEEIDDLQEAVAVLVKENELSRKSWDRLTNAIIVGSLSIVGAAVAVILFGPSA